MVFGTDLVNHGVLGRITRAAQIHGPELITFIELDGGLIQLIGEIGEQLELDDGGRASEFPPPDIFTAGLEFGIQQGPFEPPGVDGVACDLQIDLDVDVGRPQYFNVTVKYGLQWC